MGRRSRQRRPSTPAAAPAGGARRDDQAAAAPRRAPDTALRRLGDERRTLALLLLGALVVAAASLIGTLTLTGTLAPWIVLAVVVGATLLLFTWAQARLEGRALTDDDRMMQTGAVGLLVLAVVFSLVAAILLTVT